MKHLLIKWALIAATIGIGFLIENSFISGMLSVLIAWLVGFVYTLFFIGIDMTSEEELDSEVY